MARVLVVFSSLFGANAELADIVEKALADNGAEVRVRGVPQLVLGEDEAKAAKDVPLATGEDLSWADGFIFTSPAHTGLLSASIKAFIDDNHEAAVAGEYLDKTFTAMATGAFRHAGQERVVDELNAVAAAWGCLVVSPSTANASLNALDGNPYGLSFVLEHGALPPLDQVNAIVKPHVQRFVRLTDTMAKARPESSSIPKPRRHSISDVLG